MRRLWGLLFLLAGLSAAFLPQALASLTSTVQLPGANPARYRTVSANSWFIKCQVPQTIIVQKGKSLSGPHFSCDNHFNTGVTLTWTVENDGNGGTLLTIPAAQSSLYAANSSGCNSNSVTLTAGSTVASNQTVTFKGTTGTASGLYVEIHFTGTVTVQNNAPGQQNGCP